MMRVRIQIAVVVDGSVQLPGAIVELPETAARILIRNRQAEAVSTETLDEPSPVPLSPVPGRPKKSRKHGLLSG